MKCIVRASLTIGLLAAGLICLGSGIASAHPAPAHHPVAHPQYVVKRGPIGMLVDGVVRHLQAELAPPNVMQPMGSADRP